MCASCACACPCCGISLNSGANRIKSALVKADEVVKPYLKSLHLVTWRDAPVIRQLLAVAHNLLPASVSSKLFGHNADETEKMTANTRKQALRSCAPTPTPATPLCIRSESPPIASKPLHVSPGKETQSSVVVSTSIPELKLDKLVAAQKHSQTAGPSEMEKAGADMARSMGDLFKTMGSSMDSLNNLMVPQVSADRQLPTAPSDRQSDPKKAPKRGTIVT